MELVILDPEKGKKQALEVSTLDDVKGNDIEGVKDHFGKPKNMKEMGLAEKKHSPGNLIIESVDEHTLQVKAVIRELIREEMSAVESYEFRKQQLEELGFIEGAMVLESIKNEENIHQGELTALLSKVDDSFASSLLKGVEEVEEITDDSELDLNITSESVIKI